MSPPKITEDGNVEIPLDEYTLSIVREAAREAVREYHETCPIIREFRTLHADFYGVDGQKDEHPGVFGEVREIVSHIHRLWAVALVMLGAIAGPVWTWITTKQQ